VGDQQGITAMFDFVFSAGMAYQQVGMFIGTLICFGLGGLILGYSISWHVHKQKVTGTIIGVIEQNGMYAPVYRYTTPDGQTYEAKSDTSSSMTGGKETGRTVPLLISPHNPTRVRQADDHLSEVLLDIFGLLLLGAAFWLGYTAVTSYPVTPMTFIMAIAMLIFLAMKGRRAFIPKGKRPSLAEWRKQRGLGPEAKIDLSQVKPIEGILAKPEIQQAQQAQLQQARKIAPFVALFAMILLGIGIWQSVKMAELQANGLRAQGQVVRMKEERSSGSGSSSTSYYPIVRFQPAGSRPVEFKDSVGSNPPGYRTGDKVTVLYLAGRPQQDAIIDRGFWLNRMIPGLIYLFAAVLAGVLVAMRRTGPGPDRSTLVAAH
jgi:hypothetical protein